MRPVDLDAVVAVPACEVARHHVVVASLELDALGGVLRDLPQTGV